MKGDGDAVSFLGKRASRESWKVSWRTNGGYLSTLSEENKYLMLLMISNDLFLIHLP